MSQEVGIATIWPERRIPMEAWSIYCLVTGDDLLGNSCGNSLRHLRIHAVHHDQDVLAFVDSEPTGPTNVHVVTEPPARVRIPQRVVVHIRVAVQALRVPRRRHDAIRLDELADTCVVPPGPIVVQGRWPRPAPARCICTPCSRPPCAHPHRASSGRFPARCWPRRCPDGRGTGRSPGPRAPPAGRCAGADQGSHPTPDR